MFRSHLPLFAAAFMSVVSASFAEGLSPFNSAYVGASGTIALRQGGGRLGGGDVKFGAYLSDDIALDFDAGWHENSAFLAARGLVHLSAFELYDRFFGYSRFDPFFTLGGGGWIEGFGR